MYLVTGGAGFIGSNLVGARAGRGDSVPIGAGYPGRLTPLDKGVALYMTDYLVEDDPYR